MPELRGVVFHTSGHKRWTHDEVQEFMLRDEAEDLGRGVGVIQDVVHVDCPAVGVDAGEGPLINKVPVGARCKRGKVQPPNFLDDGVRMYHGEVERRL